MRKFERLDATHAYTWRITSPLVEAFLVKVAECTRRAMGIPHDKKEHATKGLQEIPVAMPSSEAAQEAAAEKAAAEKAAAAAAEKATAEKAAAAKATAAKAATEKSAAQEAVKSEAA